MIIALTNKSSDLESSPESVQNSDVLWMGKRGHVVTSKCSRSTLITGTTTTEAMLALSKVEQMFGRREAVGKRSGIITSGTKVTLGAAS